MYTSYTNTQMIKRTYTQMYMYINDVRHGGFK